MATKDFTLIEIEADNLRAGDLITDQLFPDREVRGAVVTEAGLTKFQAGFQGGKTFVEYFKSSQELKIKRG